MSDLIEWLEAEAQRHSQSASDKAFTSRRRSTFRHRAKKLREAANKLTRLEAENEKLRAGLKEIDSYMEHRYQSPDMQRARTLVQSIIHKSND